MKKCYIELLILSLSIAIYSLEISGNIKDIDGAAVKGVVVKLNDLNFTTTSDDTGWYSFTNDVSVKTPIHIAENQSIITLKNGYLDLPIRFQNRFVSAELYDLRGRLIIRLLKTHSFKGNIIPIPMEKLGAGINFLKISSGNVNTIIRFSTENPNVKSVIKESVIPNSINFDETAIISKHRILRSDETLASVGIDTIIFSKSGYITKKILVPTYSEYIDVVLNKTSDLLTSASKKVDVNQSYFNYNGGIKLHEKSSTGGTEENKGMVFDYAHQWNSIGRSILWVLDFKQTGLIHVTPFFGANSSEAGSVIEVSLDGELQNIKTINTGGSTSFSPLMTLSFKIRKTGKQVLRFKLKSLKGNTAGNLNKVTLAGSATVDMGIWTARWRPEAVHCSWASSEVPWENIKLWVMEVAPKIFDCYQYCPVTGGGGYYGSPWQKDKKISGFNFSIWSYSKDAPEPPVSEKSYIFAVGRGLSIDEYHHEGHGVKPRGDHPWIGQRPDRQIIGRLFEFGSVMTTMYGYYFDEIDWKWKLFAAGKYKADKKGAKIGAFVEVAGPPPSQRTAPSIRKVQYSGWTMDFQNQWHPIDIMKTGNGRDSVYKTWGVEDNAFYMTMGGIEKYTTTTLQYKLSSKPDFPNYLADSLFKVFQSKKLPATFNHNGVSNIKATSVVINCDVSDLGMNQKSEIFWGKQDGLTYGIKADTDFNNFWEFKKDISLSNGNNSISINGLSSNTTYYYRFRIINDEGTTWSFNTGSFKTN